MNKQMRRESDKSIKTGLSLLRDLSEGRFNQAMGSMDSLREVPIEKLIASKYQPRSL